jgi:hypothetical protein
MAYPPPPGLSKLSTQAPPANLPARPPPSAVSPAATFKPNNAASKPAFAAFAPRAVASAAPARTNSPAHYASQTQYNSAPQYSYPGQNAYPAQSFDQYAQSGVSTPQIRNPFVPSANTSATGVNGPTAYDPDYEAQIQQWQSAYMGTDNKSGSMKPISTPTATTATTATSSLPVSRTDTPNTSEPQKTVKRSGGGTEWTDSTLLEWDPSHFRLFVGNLAGEVTDESLHKAFIKYPSIQKARVIRDKRTTKSKGYGFVSFSDGDDYFSAAKEMNGKYIGSHPVIITKAKTEVRATTIKDKRRGKGGHGKVDHGGINKKAAKTKGGLKILG